MSKVITMDNVSKTSDLRTGNLSGLQRSAAQRDRTYAAIFRYLGGWDPSPTGPASEHFATFGKGPLILLIQIQQKLRSRRKGVLRCARVYGHLVQTVY